MNWLDNLRDAVSNQPDKIPAGFVTSKQAAKALKCSFPEASRILNRGVKAGITKRVMFRVKIARGIALVPHYGPASPKNR